MKCSTQGQKVRMRSVRSENSVPFTDVGCYANSRCLLTDDQMTGALDYGLAELVANFFLSTTDLDQLSQPHREQGGGGSGKINWFVALRGISQPAEVKGFRMHGLY